MSETVAYTGKLIPRGHVTDFLDERGIDYYAESDFAEIIFDNFYETHVLVGDEVYEVDMRDITYDDIFQAEKNRSGVIDFTIRYHNGGMGFNEAIYEAIKKMSS